MKRRFRPEYQDPKPASMACPAVLRFVAWGVALGSSAGVAWAQVGAGVVLPPTQASPEVSRLRPTLPPPSSPYDLRLQTPQRGVVPRAVDEVEFLVREVRFEGATRYSAEVLREPFVSLLGQSVRLQAVRERVEALQARYRQDGHVLTRVLIPPQQVQDGVLTIQVIEGHVARLAVQAASPRQTARIEAAMRPVVGRKPLALGDLEEALLRLNDMPGMAAQGTLRPGDALGASELVMTVDESRRWVASWALANASSAAVGRWVGSLGVSVAEPLALPGRLSLGLSAGLKDPQALQVLSAQQAWPLGVGGTQLAFGVVAGRSQPLGQAAREQGLRNDSRSTGVRLRTPLVRRWAQSLFVEAAVNQSQAEVHVGAGTAAQTVISRDRSTTAELGLNWQQQGQRGQTLVSAAWLRGLAVLEAPGSAQDPAGFSLGPRPSVEGVVPNFNRITGSAQRVQDLGGGWTLAGQWTGQHSSGPLLAGDRLALGGSLQSRGYEPARLTGDAGWGALLEVRRDLPMAEWGWGVEGILQGYLSWDAARVRLVADAVRGREASAVAARSAAAGLRWRGPQGLSADLMWARALTAVPALVATGAAGARPAIEPREDRVVFSVQQVF